jgi:transposase
MSKIRKQHSKQVKFKAALEVVKSEKTLQEISTVYGVHQSVLQKWKRQLLDEGAELFEDRRGKRDAPDTTGALERKIGQLTMELDFLKKALGQ